MTCDQERIRECFFTSTVSSFFDSLAFSFGKCVLVRRLNGRVSSPFISPSAVRRSTNAAEGEHEEKKDGDDARIIEGWVDGLEQEVEPKATRRKPRKMDFPLRRVQQPAGGRGNEDEGRSLAGWSSGFTPAGRGSGTTKMKGRRKGTIRETTPTTKSTKGKRDEGRGASLTKRGQAEQGPKRGPSRKGRSRSESGRGDCGKMTFCQL